MRQEIRSQARGKKLSLELSCLKCILYICIYSLFLTICSCSSTEPKIVEIQTEERYATGFAFLVDYQVNADYAGRNGCFLYFKKTDSIGPIEIKMDYGRSHYVVDAAPGSYFLEAINCDNNQWKMDESQTVPFKVVSHRLSLTEKIILKLDKKITGSLQTISPKSPTGELLGFFEKLNSDQKRSLISGYTASTIDGELISTDIPLEQSLVFQSSKEKCSPNMKKISSLVEICNKEEQKRNRIFLGQMKFRLAEIDGHAQLIYESPEIKRSYSSEFIKCLQSGSFPTKDAFKCSANPH